MYPMATENTFGFLLRGKSIAPRQASKTMDAEKGRKQLMIRMDQRTSSISGFRTIRDHFVLDVDQEGTSQPVHVGAERPARRPWRCAPRRAAEGTTPKRLRNAVTKWLSEPKPHS